MSENLKHWDMTANNAEDDNGKYRNLVFHNVPDGNKYAWLCLQDEQHTQYKIPLGEIKTIPEEAERANWENVLVPVRPQRYTIYDQDLNIMKKSARPLEKGWLYVYKNGYLWRELEVLEKGRVRDVNLTMYQGFDGRPATGEKDAHLILPHKIEGVKAKIQVCYSQVQWSWARINALGGMDPQDPRLEDKSLLPTSNQKSAASKLRNERMGPDFDLSGYKQNFNMKNTPIYPSDNFDTAFSRLYAQHNIPFLMIHDPLGVVYSNAENYLARMTELQWIIKHASGEGVDDEEKSKEQKLYKQSVLAYHFFFDPKNAKKRVKKTGRNSRKSKYGYVENSNVTDPRDELDKDLIEKILYVKDRRKIRKELRKLKRKHIEWLRGNVEINGKYLPVKESISGMEWFVDYNTAMCDFFSKENGRYAEGFSALTGVLSFIQGDPSDHDKDMDLPAGDPDKPRRDEDPGFLYMQELMHPKHPLHAKIFPKKDDFDPYSEDSPEYVLVDEVNDGTGDFRNAAFAHIYETDQEIVDYFQGTRRAIQTGKQLLSDYFSILMNHWQLRSPENRKYLEEMIARIAKASGEPYLKNIHILDKGKSTKGKIIPEGKARVVASIERTEINKTSGMRSTTSRDHVSVYEIHKNGDDFALDEKKMGRIATEDLGNYKGINNPWTDKRWFLVFHEHKGDNHYITKARYFVFPDIHPLADLYHNPNTKQSEESLSGAKELKYIKKIVPPLVIGFEVLNLYHAAMGYKSNRSMVKKNLEFADAIFGLMHSVPEAMELMVGRDKAGIIFEKAASRILPEKLKQYAARASFALFQKEIAYRGGTRLLNVFGAAFAGLSAVLALWDMIYSLRRGDLGAAVGYAIMAAGFTGLALVTLHASRGLTLAGPWGWVALAVITIGVLIVTFFSDSELEKWAKHGYLGKGNNGQPDEDGDYVGFDEKKAYAGLTAMLMGPRITLYKGGEVYNVGDGDKAQGVVAEVDIPLFEVGRTSLDLRVTRQYDGWGLDQWMGISKQYSIKPLKIQQVRDAASGVVTKVRYFYEPQPLSGGGQDATFRAKAMLITADNLRIPPIPPNPDLDDLDESMLVDDDAEGWVFAKLEYTPTTPSKRRQRRRQRTR